VFADSLLEKLLFGGVGGGWSLRVGDAVANQGEGEDRDEDAEQTAGQGLTANDSDGRQAEGFHER
jgi:hypothetical protein